MNLFTEKKECCGCGACYNICPRNAISMLEDVYGFVYPYIDENICVECRACVKVCNYKKEQQADKKIQKTYAAMSKSDGTLMKSASGGAFFELALAVIQNGGVVFGCVMERENGRLVPKHVGVDSTTELGKMQGSKYVQSNIGDCYNEIKYFLKCGRTVLFTGTPCQVDGLYGFLMGQKYENLYTMDIICHGVPSARLFQCFVQNLEGKLHGKIIDVKFRDKAQGWGLSGSIFYKDKADTMRKKRMPLQGFSYYKLFLASEIYRENCYSCKYANIRRPGDITVGDFWGIENEHPELLKSNGGEWNVTKGVSCIIVNSQAGCDLLDKVSSRLMLAESTVEKVCKNNKQMNQPSIESVNRENILNIFKNQGYSAVEEACYKRYGIKGVLYKMWNYIPGRRILQNMNEVNGDEKKV